MYMVRKQLYIGPDQERRLKQRARALGVSEAELVRRALERALSDDAATLPRPDREAAVSGLVATIDRLARRSAFPTNWKFSRQEIYFERERRIGPA